MQIALIISISALVLAVMALWQAQRALTLQQRRIFLDDEENELCIRISKRTRNALIQKEDEEVQRIGDAD